MLMNKGVPSKFEIKSIRKAVRKGIGIVMCASFLVSAIPIWSTGSANRVFADAGAAPKIIRMAAFHQNIRYPLYKGTGKYTSASSGKLEYFYSDGYFSYTPARYNTHLASLSMCLSLAGFSTGKGSGASYGSGNIRTMLSGLCDSRTIQIHYPVPAFYGRKNKISTIGYAIGQRDITVKCRASGNRQKSLSYTLIPVVVRGEGYQNEWAGNVTLGTSGEAAGFSDAAAQITSGVNAYIRKHRLQKKKVRILITGYSRGGAAANLAAQRLTQKYGSSAVYAYTFESPQAGVSGKGTWPNIHNIVVSSDIVPCLAPSRMGFRRYGKDHIIHDHSDFSAKNTSGKMINDILLWSIGKSEGSYRKTYAKKTYLCADGERRSMEQALQQLLPRLNSMNQMNLAGLLLSLSDLGTRMNTIGFSTQMLTSWLLMSAEEKRQAEERLWNMCSTYEPSEEQVYREKDEKAPSLPSQYLSSVQMEKLHQVWAPLCDAAISFAASDRNGTDRAMLKNNLLTILGAHSASACLKLVQGQDSYYR